jgi:hypothetical protein
MHPEKALMESSASKLMKKAADCFELAETQQQVAERQHEIADRQHSGADDLETSAPKLEALGHALEADAAEIQGNTQVVARGISPARSGSALPPRSQIDRT